MTLDKRVSYNRLRFDHAEEQNEDNQTKSRIVFILPSFAGGGAERVVINLLHLLDRKIFAPILIVIDPHGPIAEQVPKDVPVVAIEHSKIRFALPSLVKAIRLQKPAVVFSTFNHINLPLLLIKPMLAGAKLIVREANLPSANIARMPLPWIILKCYGWFYPRADCIIVSSRRMKTELHSLGVPYKRMNYLSNPVYDSDLRASAKTVFRHPGEGQRFIAVGRLTCQKGFDRLVRIMMKLPETSHCTILGEGPERTTLEEQIAQLDIDFKISLKGFVRCPAPFIAGADAFVMPSRFEGMPNAALEALALGTPVIATPEAGGLTEIKAVIVARAGCDFRNAMKSCKEDPVISPRQSLLPLKFKADNVYNRLNFLMTQIIGDRSVH